MAEPGAAAPLEVAAAYPAELEREIVLRDGAHLRLRPIRGEDQQRLVEFYGRLSLETAYQRFFTVMRRLPPDWARMLTTVDYRRRLALVAETAGPEAPELVAVARYEPTADPLTAEIAFVVRDDWQNRGLGTVLLGALLGAAETRGIRRFQAFVLADNRRMLDMLTRFTVVRARHTEAGVTELLFTRTADAGTGETGPATAQPPSSASRRRSAS